MHGTAAVNRPHLIAASPLRARGRRASTVRMALREDGPSVAIVGATGAVGQEFLRVISDLDFPYRSLRLLASERSAGKRISFEDREYTVQDLAAPGAFEGVDIALFSAGGGVSRSHAPAAVASGAVVVDNSSAFRMDPEVPLVIPEVNPEAMANVLLGQGAIVANPNCSTIICLMAATPLHRHAKVLRMVVSTYQAASGAGAAAMEELKLQTQEVLEGKTPTCNIFSQQYAFNIFSHNAPILENGYNEEEMKMVKETRKIWNDKDVKVTATRIRVPVIRAHAESVNLQFEKPLDEDTAREILRSAPGVTIIDDRASNQLPTPLVGIVHAGAVDHLYVAPCCPTCWLLSMLVQWTICACCLLDRLLVLNLKRWLLSRCAAMLLCIVDHYSRFSKMLHGVMTFKDLIALIHGA